MSRVAIIGSCITRDLWPIRGDAIEALLYVSRTSLPSLFARAAPEFAPKAPAPNGLTRYQHGAVLSDVQKTALAALIAHRPTHIIVDFIDERFDLLSNGTSLITHSWELETTGYLDQPPLSGWRRIPRLSEACTALWVAAAGELTAFLRETPLREATLILHRAQWATRYRDGARAARAFEDNVQIWEGRPTRIADHNRLLHTYETAFLELNPDAVLVASPEHRIADAGHRWGLSPFHYGEAYYEDIWRQLEACGITLARTLEAAPSAPEG